MVAISDIKESEGGRSASPCWRCGGTISRKNVGYNIHTVDIIPDPFYHPSVLDRNSAAPCDKYRWLCWRCAKVEGWVW